METMGVARSRQSRQFALVRRSLAVAGLWGAISLISALQAAARGGSRPFAGILFDSAIDWGTCAVFTPVVLWLVARYPVVRRPVVHVPLQLAAIIGVVIAKFALQLGVLAVIASEPRPTLRELLGRGFVAELVLFAGVFAIVHAVLLYDRVRSQELTGLALRAELADSRLDALVHKIEPHFLFNTLQAISTLLQRDPRAADAMINGLSDLLRELMRSDAPHEVPLAAELASARRYLDIMAIRFGDRLTVAIDAAGDTAVALVPRLVLQPLLENALRHGVASSTGPATLAVIARRTGAELELVVTDDGRGDTAPAAGTGVGLAHTRERLHRLYGAAARLETTRPASGGFRAAVQLPFRSAP
jgi:two-component sensor histidine kinase